VILALWRWLFPPVDNSPCIVCIRCKVRWAGDVCHCPTCGRVLYRVVLCGGAVRHIPLAGERFDDLNELLRRIAAVRPLPPGDVIEVRGW
jgi:hypothetical protein